MKPWIQCVVTDAVNARIHGVRQRTGTAGIRDGAGIRNGAGIRDGVGPGARVYPAMRSARPRDLRDQWITVRGRSGRNCRV